MSFFESVSLEEIKLIIENILHRNVAYGIDNMNYKHFMENKEGISKKILYGIQNGSYKFKPYKELLLMKNKNEPPRCISIPTLTDKVCLKLLQNYLKEMYEDEIVKQKIPQTHIKELKESLNKFSHYIKVDLEKFFNSIDQKKLEGKLNCKLCAEDVNLIMNAIKNPTGNDESSTGVPQGISISNILTDIYMMDVDKKFGRNPEIFYVRYVDDILILCKNDNYKKTYEDIKKVLTSKLNLKLHTDKTNYADLSDSFDYLGYKVYLDNIDKEYKVAIKDAAVRKIEKKIIKIIQQYKYSHRGDIPTRTFIYQINLLVTGAITSQLNNENILSEKRYGWLFFYSQTDSIKALYHLDTLIEKKVNKLTSKMAEYRKIQLTEGIKKFVTAYFEIKYNYSKTNYIFRPDQLNIEERKEFLINTFGYTKNLLSFEYNKDNYPNEEEFNQYVDKLYYKNVYTQIKKQEKDVLDMIS